MIRILLVLAMLPIACERAAVTERPGCPEGYGPYEVVEVPDLGKFCLDDNRSHVKQVFRQGRPWSQHILDQVEEYAVPGSTAVDAGAHIGSITVPLARAVGVDGKVYAFEPEAKSYAELLANIALNELGNVLALDVALGQKTGAVAMRTTAVDGISWVVEGEEIELRDLDSFDLANVSFIKIDVEGYGARVLRGASKTIQDWHPVIVIEISSRERDEGVEQIFSDHGYTLRLIKGHDYLATWEEPEDE
jgi:FkbM family methyltransferase